MYTEQRSPTKPNEKHIATFRPFRFNATDIKALKSYKYMHIVHVRIDYQSPMNPMAVVPMARVT